MKKKQNSFLRFLRVSILYAIGGGIIGGAMGAYFGYTGKTPNPNAFILLKEQLINVVLTLNHLIFGMSLVLSFIFLVQLKRTTDIYNTIENDDDSEKIYRQLNKKYSYTMLLITIASILAMCNILISLKLSIGKNYAMLAFPIWDFLALIMILPFQAIAMKRYNAIRGTKVPLFPNIKELRNNIMEMDEAELQACYKTSFESVLSLNSIVIPSLYIILFFICLLTGQVELTAILVLVLIQLYLLVKSVGMTRRFYH
ncbi:DUF3169 family protein [Streptococcus castoreus]|uniref:DUF3169 family protein n=1 Tax=Streptococcus castoreus TaxID=254786 RepID=UPI0003F609F4|nr:DUF3169 family protein [Streptococcus castoreus]